MLNEKSKKDRLILSQEKFSINIVKTSIVTIVVYQY